MSFYRIYFHPPREIAERQYIDNLTGAEPVAMNSIKSFFEELPIFGERTILQDGETMISIYHDDTKCQSSEEQISGILQAGEDGFSSEIHDGQSGEHRLSRTPDDIEFMPFYYLVDGKAGARDLILGLQHFGGYGISTKFIPQIRSYLKLLYPDYVIKLDAIHLGPIFFDGIMKNGIVREIEAVSFIKTTDKASKKYGDIKVTTSYGPSKRGGFLPQAITNIVKKESSAILNADNNKELQNKLISEVRKLLSIKLEEDISDLSATMICNGTVRKIDLGNIYKFATRYDITDSIKTGENRHPIFDSIDKTAKEILEKDIRSLIK